jgi:hypothetical protein
MVKHPQEYRWSSHRAYLALDKADLIDSSLVLSQFSDDPSAARGLYASFIMQGATQGRRGDLYDVRDQRILGDTAFIEEVFESDRGSEGAVLERIPAHFELDELKEIVESVMGNAVHFLGTRGRVGTWIRRIFCYIARAHGDHRGREVARYLGKDLATVTQGVRFVEEALRSGNREAREVVETVLEMIANMEDRSERGMRRKLKSKV